MQTLLFSENMKHLREQILKCNQSEIPNRIGFPRSTWSGYERGASKPSLDDLMNIAQIFGISEYDLLHTELAEERPKIQAPTPDELVKKLAKTPSKSADSGGANSIKHALTASKNTIAPHSKGANATPIATNVQPQSPKKAPKEGDSGKGNYPGYGASTPHIITINEHGIDNIIYVPVRAQAGYLMGYGDQEYIESLPSFRMPGLNNNSYRMFEVQGVSMAPTLTDKDRVIAEWVPSLSDIRENRVHVIVHKDGVAIKRVLNRVNERDKIYLKSDTLTHRQDYPIKEIDPADIVEIWYVRMKVSGDLSEPSEIYTRVADLEIKQYEIMKKLGLNG